MRRVGILVLFLILEETLSSFHHWVWCLVWVCRMQPWLGWYMFPTPNLLRVFFFYHEWLLNFVRCFFCISWEDYVIFSLLFFNGVYHFDWFEDIVSSMWPWNNSNLIMVYDPFIYWWISLLVFCWEFFHLYSSEMLACNFFFFFFSAFSFGIRIVVAL